jgi:hypothetical protein
MKILLSEQQVKKVLLELNDTKHIAERFVERCLHEKLPIALVRKIELGHGQTREQIDKVGNYTFSDSDKSELKEKILQIFSYDYNKKSYGVVLQRFDIRRRVDKIEFFGDTSKKMALDHMNQRGNGLYFVDFDDDKFDIYNREKYADSVALIIRGNEAVTAMWGMSTKFTNKDFFRTDHIITKIQSLITNGATKSAEVPERIKKVFNVNTKPEEKMPEDVAPEETPVTQDVDNNDVENNITK